MTDEPKPYTMRDLVEKELELARGAGASDWVPNERWVAFLEKALGIVTTGDELKRLAETPAQKEARRRFYEGREADIDRGDDEVDWSNFTIKSMYGMVEIASDPEYHHPTVEDKEAYFEWAKRNQTGDGHGNYFTPSFDDWMQMMYPANYRHGRELQ